MKTRIARQVGAYALGSLLALAGCDDGGSKKVDDEGDPSLQGDASGDADPDAAPERTRDGGRNSGDGGSGGDGGGRGGSDGGASDDGGGASMDGGSNGDGGADGGSNPQSDATISPGSDASNPQSDGGGKPTPGGDCAAKAKAECEYQKMCDPVEFAIEWDGDINQFCIPKRKAACEAGLPLTTPRAIGEACDTWVKASCDNYRNFYYPVKDSNGKWQYGDRSCEVTPTIPRGNLALDEACTNAPDTQCKPGLFCKVEDDNYRIHGDQGIETICGKCAPQYAYDGAYTLQGFTDDENVCYRQEQCKAGYQCLRVYGMENNAFVSLDYLSNGTDLNHCVKTITVVGQDKDCAKGSNVRCDEGLECQGATPADIVGKCKVASNATIPTYVGKDARCDPAECDRRLHLECKPVNTGTTTEKRCVQTAVSAIGAYCKNDKNEVVATCSRYGRCVDSTGLCVRRDTENQPCFNSSATPSVNDPGSCDPSVYKEDLLVCRREGNQLMTTCQKPLPQNLCRKR